MTLPDQYLRHHDLAPLPNGNVLLITFEAHTAAEAIAAGRDPNHISSGALWGEAIFEVRPTPPVGGQIVVGMAHLGPPGTGLRYSSRMRRKSAIDRAKQAERIERARRMTPEQRLEASASVSAAVMELHRAGHRDRQELLKKRRS